MSSVESGTKEVLDESQRNPVSLVKEYGILYDDRIGLFEHDRDFPGLKRSIPDEETVSKSAVLLPPHLIVDIAEVCGVTLSEIVSVSGEHLVVSSFLVEHAGCAKTVVGKRKVEFRGDVLGRKHMDVVLRTVGVRQQRTPVGQLRVWSLGIVHRKSRRRRCIRLQRLIE